MRTLVVFLVVVGLVGALIYYGLLAQPPAIEARAQPTPVPTPVSTIAGMGEGASLLGPSRQLLHVGTPGAIVPQTTPPPKHR